MRAMIVLAAALLLTGCGTVPKPATVEGECRVFDDPGFRVRGVTTRDKRWIATTQEKGIQVCGWRRPPSMPEPQTAQAQLFSCDDVRKVVSMFGGDVARAEAYAVSQGATPEQIVEARACLEQPTMVRAPGLGSRHRMTRKQQDRFLRAEPATAPAAVPVSATVPVGVPSSAVAAPTAVAPAVAVKRCKVRKYRWQYWRPRTCA